MEDSRAANLTRIGIGGIGINVSTWNRLVFFIRGRRDWWRARRDHMRRLLRGRRLDWREHLHVTFTLIGPNGVYPYIFSHQQELDSIEWIRTDGARLGDLGELERVKIIFDVDRGLFERDLAEEGVRRRRRGRRLGISLVR
jgi:hypothetical protein